MARNGAGLLAVVALAWGPAACGSEPEEDVRPLGPVATPPVLESCAALVDETPSPSTNPKNDADGLEADLESAADALHEELGITADAKADGAHAVGVSRDREGPLLMVIATRVDGDMPTEFRGHRVRYCRGGPFVAH